jgi:EmrB/QacA subfamily drug resistance transporter
MPPDLPGDDKRGQVTTRHRDPRPSPDTKPNGGIEVAAASATDGNPNRWKIMWVLGTVAFMAQLDFFVVNVALDGIGKSFPGSNVSGLSWLLSAYAIVFAAVLIPSGRIADLYGRKKVLLSGIGIFTLASILASLSPDLGVLIGARAIQAIGAAMIVPTSLGLLYPSFPKRQHTLVVSLWAGGAAVAASAGPPVGGLLVTLDWRWIFLVNVPIGIAAIIAGARYLPEVRQSHNRRLPDYMSVVSLLFAVSLLVLATVQGPGWGWGDSRTIALFAAAALFTVTTLQRIFKAADPVVEKDLFKNRQFTAATIATFLFFIGLSVFLLGTTLFMQEVWHFSALRAGLGIAPAPTFSIAFTVAAAPIQKRFGRTLPAVVGTLSMAMGAGYWLLTVHGHPAYWSEMFPALFFMGIAGGLSQPPMFAAAGLLPPHRATTGSAVLNMSRQVGGAVGVAVLVALTAAAPSTAGFDRAWWVQAIAASTAALVMFVLRTRPGKKQLTS